jgi:hypothetical protein
MKGSDQMTFRSLPGSGHSLRILKILAVWLFGEGVGLLISLRLWNWEGQMAETRVCLVGVQAWLLWDLRMSPRICTSQRELVAEFCLSSVLSLSHFEL